ncbi:MAG: translation initiation factor IF-2 [Acidobacteriia bacterium]|jgi:translation initiation factor IF-2|nr:translation initiation factor IF-2 [Terriglobia bacterium]
MAESGHIRINELARELEIKAKAILEYLPEIGVTESKTHSSSISAEIADKVRQHFRQLAEAEAAEVQATAQKAADEAAAKTARIPPPPPAQPAPATPPRPAAPAPPVRPVPAAPATAPPAPSPPQAVRPAATSAPARKPAPAAPAAPPPRTAPPPGKTLRTTPRPAGATPASAPQVQRPPVKPPAPARPASRPAATSTQPVRATTPSAAPVTEKIPPKAEPGKPIYARKPTRDRPLIEKRFAEGERKLHPVRARPGVVERRGARVVAPPPPVVREPREITITEGITVRELAEKLDVRAKDLLKTLLDKGIFASINQALDIETATSLAQAFNGIVKVVSFEEEVAQEIVREEKPENLQPRAPVVTVMGHVDHGKTSLLDAIRQTNVAEGEAGGITQHIGASQVEINGRKIVFIDTPGHEAFTRMRARGARVTDVVVLVVAADDGVKPQTLEAIDHARAAGVPIIVAINKVDKPEAQPERVKRQLADLGLVPEEWGGDTVMVEVSAKLKKNLDRLLEMILLVGDLRELKANPNAPATGTVLESRIDKGRGPVATVLVQNGTLRVGDAFLCGAVYGKVRAMLDDRGHSLKEAGPSTPVEVLGLQGLPEAGDQFQVADEARARQIVEYRQAKRREASLARTAGPRITLDQLHEQLKAGEVKELPLVVKADVQGSVEVLSELLPRLSTDQVKIKIVHAGVGAVAETDVLLASASNAIIIAFNVRPDRKAAELAQRENVDIRTHTVIYEVADEIKKAIAGLLEPVLRETYLGRAEVRETFRIKGVGTVAGCYVQDGVVRRDAEVRLLRDGAVVYTGRPGSLKRFKDDVNEVRAGYECGIAIANFNDVKVGDILEFFRVEKVAAPEVTA